MVFDASSDFWQLLAAAVVGLGTGGVIVLTRLPVTRQSRSLRELALCGSLWALGDLITSLATTLFWEQVGIAILYSGVIFLPPLWWRLALHWTEDRGVRLPFDSARWTRLPLILAGLLWVLMLTNPWHGEFVVPVIGGRNIYRPLWWVNALHGYGLILGALAVEMSVLLRGMVGTRRQSVFMIAAGTCTLVANWADVSSTSTTMHATIPMLAVSGVILIAGMVREGLFGVMPLALPLIASRDPDGLVVVNPEGGLLYANDRARALLAPVDLDVGTPLLASLAPHLLEADGTPIEHSGLDWEELWWRSGVHKDGTLYRYGDQGERWLRIGTERVHGRTQRLLAHCLRVHDSTEEQHAEAETRRTRRLESVAELALGVAHDFNNLLTVIRGNAELLAHELPDDPELKTRLERIRRAGFQAMTLAQQLQLYAGETKPARTLLDLTELVRDMVDTLDLDPFDSADHTTSRVRLELSPDPLTLEADTAQLQQLILNLLVNARDALGGKEGEIRVATGCTWLEPARIEHLVSGRDAHPGDYAYLRVIDSGCGMDAATQERVFEPFFSTKGKQRGIGLSTVLGIVRSHDALLELDSGVESGTSFTVYFPMSSEDEGAG